MQLIVTDQISIDQSLRNSVDFLIQLIRYADGIREMIQEIAEETLILVEEDIMMIDFENNVPLIIVILSLIFIPVCVMFTLNITHAMTRFTNMFDEKVERFRKEKANSASSER